MVFTALGMRRLSNTVDLIRLEKPIFSSVQVDYIILSIGSISRSQSVKACISWSQVLRTSHGSNGQIYPICTGRKMAVPVRIRSTVLEWTCMWH